MTQDIDRLPSAVEQVADALRRGECILFVGAGVHAPPPEGSNYTYPDAVRPMSSTALSHRLAAETGFCENESFHNDSPGNLLRTSLYYEMQNGRRQLIDAVANAVHIDKEPSVLLDALAELDFRVLLTTNYDQLLEDALRNHGKTPQIAVYNKERVAPRPMGTPTAEEPLLIKLHGDIVNSETIVITDEDYIDFALRVGDPSDINPFPLDFLFYSKKWTTLFVGYSLLDYNLRILFRSMRWTVDPAHLPLTYALDRNPDPLVVDVWWNKRRYVQFIVDDSWRFVPRLYEAVTGRDLMP